MEPQREPVLLPGNPEFMRQAIELAREGMHCRAGGPFGAVVIREGRVIGKGCNRVTSSNDPTAHAEVVAIRDACGRIGNFLLAGTELYTSCYPCPMCFGAIFWARLDRVYYAGTPEDAAAAGFDDAEFWNQVRLPSEARKVPEHELLRTDAQAVFQAWRDKPDKIRY